MAAKNKNSLGPVAYINARLLDPASGLDKLGGVLTEGEILADFGPGLAKKKDALKGTPKDIQVVDCKGKCLAPGLVDMRIEIGDLTATVAAAVSGGVTSAVAYYNRGLTYHDKGDIDIAINDFNKALEINPRFSWAYNNLGYIFLFKKNDHIRGCHYYEQACMHGDCKLINLVKQNGICK